MGSDKLRSVDPVILPGDEMVRVRVLLAEDHERLRAMFSRVSPETIYRRFHTPYPHVPEWMTEFLMEADRRGGRSVVAVVGEEIVGHAMRSRPEAGEAEVAIVVEDRWQGSGVGKPTRDLGRLARPLVD